ncbi:Kinesin-like protein KIF14 [Armadillidium vulgare]|nr:Kinesin-like protein KIF14 [Armadillidium vulgare]
MKNITSLNKISDAENYQKSPKSRYMLKQNEIQECKPSAEWTKTPLRESNKASKAKISSTVGPKTTPKLLESPAYKYSYMNRKSVEESTSSQKSDYPPLNTSHPPLNRFLNPSGATSAVVYKSTPKSNSKFLSSPITPKGFVRTPRNTSLDEKGSSQNNVSKARVSVEGRNTPVPHLTVSGNTPQRKSVGSNRKNDNRKSSSLRKSSSQNSCSSLSNFRTVNGAHLTPLNLNQRLPSQGLLMDSHSKKGDIQTPSGIIYDLDRRDDEPDSSSSLVSVGVRVRPISERESQNSNICNIISMNGNEVIVRCENGSIHTFSYDYCFDSSNKRDLNYASQNIMGEENGNSCLLDSSFEENDENNTGILPRFCKDLFSEAQSIHSRNADKGAQSRVEIEISYIEIYNEKIYDLIGSHCSTMTEDSQKLSSDKKEALKVREHPRNGPYVVGASFHLVTSYEDLQMWIILGNKQRSIAATGMNDKSSRSHSVFSITVTQTETELIQGEEMEHSRISKINLVDLAGSERVAASNSEGDRLKESLGGNSKTSMIATISPCNIHQEESLSTLRYAQQARKIVNWNRINEDPTSKIIRALKLEVERLRSLQVCCSPRNLTADFERDAEEETDSHEIPSSELHTEEQRSKEKDIILLKEAEIKLLKEKLRSTQEQFSEKAKLLEDKVQEAEQSKLEALERCRLRGLALKVEDNRPTLVNLCEDPQLSQTLLYNLKKGPTTFGTSNADVTLSGLHDTDIHWYVSFTIRNELNLQQASARADMLRELEEQKNELKLQEIFMKDNVQILSNELNEERNVKQEVEIEKMMLEEEKRLLENQINSFKRLNSQSSDSCSQSSSPNQEDGFFKNMEMIFNESVRTVETSKPEIEKENVENWFLVAEANSICTQLKKPYHFQQQSVLKDNGFEILVIVHDLDHNLCAWLDVTQLKKVLTLLRDMTMNEDDNSLLETLIPWEREDKISKMPVIQNKIRENVKRLSINQTLNSSFGSGLNMSFNSNIYNGVPGILNQSFQKFISPAFSSTSIAKAVSKVLLHEITTEQEYSPIFINIIEDLLKFHSLLKSFINHFREFSSSSEDSEVLDQEIVKIALQFCRSYLVGISKGLEWNVQKTADASHTAISCLLISEEDPTQNSLCEQILNCAHDAFRSVSNFLDQFRLLKVTPSIEPTMSEKDVKREVKSFLIRVSRASKNTEELISSFVGVSQQIREIYEGSDDISPLEKNISKLQENLGELVDDAGLRRSTGKSNSISSLNSEESFLDELYTLARKAFKDIDKMKSILRKYSKLESHPIRNGIPMKSCLKTSELKKVRFDVSLCSTITGSFLDDHSEDDTVDV